MHSGQQQQQQALPPLSTQPPHHQGVLWKRRDVFKNRWRPRWFCLQANQGVLTYYLLTAAASSAPPPPIAASSNNNGTTTFSSSASSGVRRNRNVATTNTTTTTIGRVISAAAATRSSCYGTSTATDDSDNGDMQEQEGGDLLGPSPYSSTSGGAPLRVSHHHRDRATSWDSTVSENTVDYDVVPRGSLYLLGGCTVEMNESLSKPREHLFAFTIKSPHEKTTEIHLAARSAQARREWVEQLLRVCDYGTISASLQQARATAAAQMPPPPLPLTVSLARQRSSVEQQRLGGTVPSVAEMNECHEDANGNDNDFFQEAMQQKEESKPEESTSATWQSTSPTSSLFANVPTDLAEDIQHRLNKYLPMIDDDDESSPSSNANSNWTKLFERNGHEAYVTVLPNTQQEQPTPGTTTNTTSATGTTPTTAEGTAVVKTIAYLEHSPRQVFNLLMDPSRRREYESDVRSTCRLQTYNPHTCLDLTMYNPIWPMSARELATVVHWQVMSKTKKSDTANDNDSNIKERSLVLVSFSCPQAQALQQHVESLNVVQAHLLLSLFVLRPMADDTATQMIRLVSLSLDPRLGGFFPVDVAAGSGGTGNRSDTNRRQGGGSGRLQKFVLGQMAGLSTVMARYLQRHEPLPPSGRFTGPLDNDLIVRDIIQHLPDASSTLKTPSSSSSNMPQQDDADAISRDENDDDSGRWDRSTAPLRATLSSGSSIVQPALERQAACLLAPVLLFQVLQCFGLDFFRFPGFVLVLFCVAAFCAVRQVVLWHIETIYPSARKTTTMMPIWNNQATRNRVFGPMTCHFAVDLKGILRFVTNKKEDREELGQGTAEVSVIHLVASALARALKKEATLRQRRVALPWLLIDQVVDASSEPIRVSVSENGGRWLTLDRVDSRPVQDIADDLAEQEQEEREFRQNIQQSVPSAKSRTVTTRRRQPVLGECLVLATPDMDQFDSEMDFNVSVLPSRAHVNNVAVVAVIGGVKLEHYDRRNSGNGTSTMQHASNGSIAGSSAPAPRPVLTLTLTISGPVQQDLSTTADFVTCRRFADDVKLLLQFPEMCE